MRGRERLRPRAAGHLRRIRPLSPPSVRRNHRELPQERYEACRAFYEQVFAVQPFYGWDEGPEDRGVKYDLAGAKLVLLTQEDPFPTYGAVHFQLEVPSLEDIFRRARAAGAVTQEPFFRPYGWHMFRMKDPAGNHINIYTVPQSTP